MKYIQFDIGKKPFAQWRDNVKVKGIPFTWSTNLTNGGVKDVYEILLKQRFFIRLKDDPVKITGVTLSVSVDFFTPTEIGYKDRICLAQRLSNDKILVKCFTEKEYEERIKKLEEESKEEEEHKRSWKEYEEKRYEIGIKCERLMTSHLYQEAERNYKALLEFELNNPYGWSNWREAVSGFLRLYYKSKNVEGALDLLNEMLNQQDFDRVVDLWRWAWFGYGFERDQDVENAEKVYKRLLSKFPEYERTYKRLAIMYERLGRYKEAIEICSNAINLSLEDGTKGGFEGRIERIRKKQKKSQR